ncbi:hypothetical protein [Alicyclobacillus sp. SO9]|uniref:hypothetical protein n=1 Tax=Alicyclobacillus sp. SO9 TaxID=2665646 RepID=UPI0018E8C74A|nr:hypothetical protein [Alicyclobacillus sp. SO9]QQE78374.1 hypothetical protein GI364_21265 [Alicyclobacillus sp. SO9]
MNRSSDISKSDTFEEQMELQNQWRFLHQSGGEFIQRLGDRSLTQSFTVKLLYIATGQAEMWDRNNVVGISAGTVSAFLHYLNDNEQGYPPKISTLLNILRCRNIEPQNFPSMTVPDSFSGSNLAVASIKEAGACSTPWCGFHGSNKGMRTPGRFCNGAPSVGHRQYHQRGAIKYIQPAVCMGCYMEYGYDPTSQWVAVRPDIERINVIRKCLVNGLSYEYIRETYAIGMSTIQRLVGYIVAHELLPKFLNDRLRPPTLSEKELMRRFRLIYSSDTKEKSKSAWVLFSWTRTQFHYYRSLDVIQRWYFSGDIHGTVNIQDDLARPANDYFMDKLVQEIEEMKRLSIEITMNEVIRRLNASFLRNVTVKSTPYREYIWKEIEQQKKILRELTIQQWWDRAKEFVGSKEADETIIYVKDVFEYIGASPPTVKRHCPQLNDWIKEVFDLSRQRQLQRKVEECRVRIEIATGAIISQNQSASIQDVLRYADVPDHIGYYYPVLVKALHDAKYRIQRNMELVRESLLQ